MPDWSNVQILGKVHVLEHLLLKSAGAQSLGVVFVISENTARPESDSMEPWAV